MNAFPLLRFAPALAGSLVITLAIFLFMESLIERGQREDVSLPVFENIEIIRPEPLEEDPVEAEDQSEKIPDEPILESLELALPAPNITPTLEMPVLDLAVGDIDIPATGDSWSAPLTGGVVSLGNNGQDAAGFVEVVPYNTRRPNVPEIAWKNKISGWVLVAFTVTGQGVTGDVRVLDANPRGVFEEKVIAAVEDWRYTLSFSGKSVGNVVLTQRVDVHWKNYPQNLPNVD